VAKGDFGRGEGVVRGRERGGMIRGGPEPYNFYDGEVLEGEGVCGEWILGVTKVAKEGSWQGSTPVFLSGTGAIVEAEILGGR